MIYSKKTMSTPRETWPGEDYSVIYCKKTASDNNFSNNTVIMRGGVGVSAVT